MCGRYVLTINPDLLVRAYNLINGIEWSPRYNIAPTQMAVVVRGVSKGKNEVKREAALMRWGLIPNWADDTSIGSRMINARSETAATKPSFRTAMKHRRCLVPVSGFYEWKKIGSAKQPYYITGDDELLTFAGLWESWTDKQTGEVIESFTILTTESNERLSELHDRMPVVLKRESWNEWLNVNDLAPEDVEELMKPAANEGWHFHAVSRQVNSPRHDKPSLIEQIE